MTPEQIKNLYRRTLDSTFYVRRYSGSGDGATSTDYRCGGQGGDKLRARMPDKSFVGEMTEQSAIVRLFVPDLVDAGFSLPILTTDRLLRADKAKEFTIIAVDDFTYVIGDIAIAADVNIGG